MVTQSTRIRAPIRIVYDAITDFENYPAFLPNVSATKILNCSDKKMEVKFMLNLIKKITYTLLFECNPPEEVHWRLKSGDMMKSNTGSWILRENGDDETEAEYTIDVELSLWVPKTITETLIEKDLPKTLKSFRRRSEKLYKTAMANKAS